MKHGYRTRVSVEGGTEETQFIPQDGGPRVRTRYVRDPEAHGKYKDGRVYSIDPEKLEEATEEAESLASEDPAVETQREQEKVAEKVGRKGRKRASKKPPAQASAGNE